jgi:hypothetical protein
MSHPYTASQVDVFHQQGIMTRDYSWMTAGLLVTGAVAMFVASQMALMSLIFGTPLFWVLIIGELALVWGLSASIHKMPSALATGLFLFYSALNGLTISVIFLRYTPVSIATTFLITAGMFGAMSLYGYTTKSDLSSWGSFLIMGLIGVLIASVVNFFLQSSMLYWIVTYAGIAVFIGLTAYDTQKIKHLSMQVSSQGDEAQQRVAILGALALYLDFINLFLFLLRIFGGNRD